LVTASTAGIGLAIAKGLAEEGAAVIINGRTVERVEQARQSIAADLPHTSISGIAAELSTIKGVQKVIERFDAVDILVNNLSMFAP
jgi:NAD(P)-dependent dehydrogenase (short-subunit alcohol dehydrogenase family)